MFTKCISIACGGSVPLSFVDYTRFAQENKPENILAICRIQRGSGRVTAGGVSTEVQVGGLLVLGCEESYVFTAMENVLANLIVFDRRLFSNSYACTLGREALAPMLVMARSCRLLTEKDACYPEVTAAVETIWKEAEAGEASSPLMAVAMLWQLAALLKKEAERQGDTLGTVRETQNKERLAPAVRFIYRHYDQKLTLADLAREASMSVPNFSSVFRRTYGLSPMEYLNRLRLQNATDLLQNTDKKIIDIAEECGFFSISNFIKAFNHSMGMSPSRYRKVCGAAESPAAADAEDSR
ncbi:MAG TPA: AraC family transcriptional regulator [Firmicutes bacterium]|nr:AraC family transcriptional regulator [Bacillota bacterium]